MPLTRIYQDTPLDLNMVIRLDDNASHHIARVLRAKVNESLFLFNGQGGEYLATINHIDKKGVIVHIHQYVNRDVESPINLILAQGIAKGEKMDFIVQKAVELGVKTIYPLITERGDVRLDGTRAEKRLQHWQAIAMSACEQCGRNRLPVIVPPQPLNIWLTQYQADLAFVLTPHVPGPLSEKPVAAASSIALLIGPEGGLTEKEITQATQEGFQPLRLGPRVLRTETATITALSVIQAQYGDLK